MFLQSHTGHAHLHPGLQPGVVGMLHAGVLGHLRVPWIWRWLLLLTGVLQPRLPRIVRTLAILDVFLFLTVF